VDVLRDVYVSASIEPESKGRRVMILDIGAFMIVELDELAVASPDDGGSAAGGWAWSLLFSQFSDFANCSPIAIRHRNAEQFLNTCREL